MENSEIGLENSEIELENNDFSLENSDILKISSFYSVLGHSVRRQPLGNEAPTLFSGVLPTKSPRNRILDFPPRGLNGANSEWKIVNCLWKIVKTSKYTCFSLKDECGK